MNKIQYISQIIHKNGVFTNDSFIVYDLDARAFWLNNKNNKENGIYTMKSDKEANVIGNFILEFTWLE